MDTKVASVRDKIRAISELRLLFIIKIKGYVESGKLAESVRAIYEKGCYRVEAAELINIFVDNKLEVSFSRDARQMHWYDKDKVTVYNNQWVSKVLDEVLDQ